ncbi:hypothetical protein PACTADRAFT_61890 [Pachysolen tannophilus NRRL Y-2460]|uniref:Uncharacterized protein n=1 Tax=Pachysolen tannophilus NRRL Y-2460 TaxID=669874 RepID=A0A1E4TN75_PACTA|nr:hypothetical protein PACTADRAFT_61890 [Pachysolen tannophilus NRRL Y-2460]
MRDYQLEGMNWLITLYENGLNGILADEMGLGKTIQSISLLAFLYEQGIKGPFLITCPLSTVSNWCNEIKRFAPGFPVLNYSGSKEKRKIIREEYFHNLNSSKPIGRKSNQVETPAIIVASYEIIIRDSKFLDKIDWKFLIVDEGHRLKNNNCLLLKELKKLRTSNRLLLTGTPLQNNLGELWSLLNFILPDIFHDVALFEQWFDFNSLQSKLETDEDDEQTKALINVEIQKSLISNLHTILKPFLLRRLKREAIKDLPPKREYIIYANLTQEQTLLYKAALKRNLKPVLLKHFFKEYLKINNFKLGDDKYIENFINLKLSSNVDTIDDIVKPYNKEYEKYMKLDKLWFQVKRDIDAKKLQNLMMQLRLICDSPYLFFFPWIDETKMTDDLIKNSGKLAILDQILPKLLSNNHKVLIFSQFTKMIDLIQDFCDYNNIKSARIDGSTDQETRAEEISSFNKSLKYQVFLLSTRAGGLGLNLVGADTVILFDSDWNPQVDLQAMDRAHRIGQTKPVIVYRMAMINTVEQVLLSKADSKRKLEKLVISMGKFETLSKLSQAKNANKSLSKEQSALKTDHDLLSYELTKLLNEHAFLTKKNGSDSIMSKDNILNKDELNELFDRSPSAYERSSDDVNNDERFKRIVMFETVSSME